VADTKNNLPDFFHPLVASWFAGRYGSPTPVQAQAWPLIAGGAHVLASAPTGSGKTLTAFLGALSRFASGDYPATGLSVLYVSPLKALNEDVRLNLVAPSRELSAWFTAHGSTFPRLRVATRSGDTPQSERRSMLKSPPAILCTTPESLAILLASRSGLELLATTRLLILDEVHAVLGTKRGSALACAVGRLALIAGEFQRVALSATVKPFSEAANFVAGRRLVRASDGTAIYEPRKISIVVPESCKKYDLSVAWPAPTIRMSPPTASPDERETDEPAGRYDAITNDLASRIAGERSTIVFADSRRRTERLAAMLNERSGEGTAWAHHGSLAKDVRKAVETRLKEGRLRCVVATGTLELGIDVGAVDLVALAGSPQRADQLLQRAGRAGHGVGMTSRAVIYPFHGLDLLAAAASVGAALEADIDPVKPPRTPLDVLPQVLLAMVLFEERALDDLFDEVRSFSPFQELKRQEFDAVAGMMAGRYSGSRLKELAGRVYLDTERNSMRARERAAMLLYSSGGSIPDRGYYAMRLAGDGTKIGELDEEFVFERRVGNSFSFGSQAWRIVEIGDEAVTVAPLDRDADFMPFWKAEKAPRGASVSARMLDACADYQADPAGFAARLRNRCGFSAEAADTLAAFLASQARAQGTVPLPSRTVLPVEAFRDPDRKGASCTFVIQSLRGSAVNEPLGIALAAVLRAITGLAVDRLTDDDAVSLALPLADIPEATTALRKAFQALATQETLAAAIRGGLAETGAFGAAFRENAGRALLLPRSGFGKRTPLWVTRLRAKRLYEKTIAYPDFPIVEETWKTVLEGRFDLPALARLFRGISDGSIALGFFSPRAPSPFAQQTGWAETNRYLYEGDAMPGARGGADQSIGSAGDAAIAAALDDASARPVLKAELVAEFSRKVRRELPGWAPESPDALAEWVDERVAIPLDEWEALLVACPAELAEAARAALTVSGSGAQKSVGAATVTNVTTAAGGEKTPGAATVTNVTTAAGVTTVTGGLTRLAVARWPGAAVDAVWRRERLAAAENQSGRAAVTGMAAEWLRSSGPEPLARLGELFGFSPDDASTAAALESSGAILVDDLGTIGGPAGVRGVCDRDNLESLLRLARKAARPRVLTLPARDLTGFIACVQGLRDRNSLPAGGQPDAPEGYEEAGEADGVARTRRALLPLSGYPAPAALWETEILPARVAGYRPEYLDELLARGDFLWFGAGRETVAFASADDFEAFAPRAESRLLAPGEPPVDAWSIKDRLGLSVGELENALWDEIWNGAIGSDSFEAVRRAAADGFKRIAAPQAASAPETTGSGTTGRTVPVRHGRIPRALGARWKAGSPLPGLWFSLALEDEARSDEADRLELAMTATRAAVRRYGLLCRAILERDSPRCRWSVLFPAIRRLELSGELVTGRFFDGIDGPQFMGQDAFRLFRDGWDQELLWSVNALDPASPCGLAVDGLPENLPSRLPVNRLAFRGGAPVCVSRRSWHELELTLPPDDPATGGALSFLIEARRRPVMPERRIPVDTINGQNAALSPYAALLAGLGFDADRGTLTLW